MKTATIALVLAIAAIGTGCSTTNERSRNLADPAVSGKTLALQVCSNCHGVDGNSVNPTFPKLAGQPVEYFLVEMKEFRNHHRADPAGFEYMWGLSKSLTDRQLDELAAYYGQQKQVADTSMDAKRESAGKIIFDHGLPAKNIPPCMACHGAEGAGNGKFPRIAGQHADYLAKQLTVFKRTDERPEGALMETIAHDLTVEDIENVSAYLSSHSSR